MRAEMHRGTSGRLINGASGQASSSQCHPSSYPTGMSIERQVLPKLFLTLHFPKPHGLNLEGSVQFYADSLNTNGTWSHWGLLVSKISHEDMRIWIF